MDRALLLAARGLRAFGFGFSAVLIGVHLEHRGLSPALIGLTLGIGLAAASLSGLASAALAARWGRRRILAAAGGLMALTGLDLALATWDPTADGVIIACLNFRSHPIIDALESRIGKPVVTSTQATLWHVLRLAGVDAPILGYGHLLREH